MNPDDLTATSTERRTMPDAGPSTQATVPAGNGSTAPVACISLVKQLRRYSANDVLAEQPGADVSVAR